MLNAGLDESQASVKIARRNINKGAWLAAVHGVARVGYDLATKQQQTD